ncbi:hypothetical protein STCU_08388 [Strigomonas culicis]|uniref:Uncharacterized protein n=1 Tax=Strigomonas culicis TaxID=28005 RepID=S9TZH6_9TRYP|nr:hypothetical protein STCU_08388 [Strigomonas culicis]|eukprot:EPY22009.1 hypothetical protein STCU_08388 [Strigomonas culicis]
MLEVNPPSLQFDDVAVNDVPCYRQLRIRNMETYPVVVQLSASSQFVKFQLENQNFTALTSPETVDFSAVYNELFDTIDLLDHVQLNVGEEKELIVMFQANPNGFTHIVVQSKPTVFTGSLQLTCASAVPGNTLFVSEGLGGVSLSKWSDTKTPTTPSVVKSESVAISFKATIFLSFLQVSTAELQATMSLNKTQVMEFTVTNLSCRPLSFVIRNQAILNKGMILELYETERFEEPKMGHRLVLDSQSSMKFSLMARTASSISSLTASQFRTVLQCDNLLDSRNTTLIYVNVHVVGESQGDLITISDSSVNFGEVYRGTTTTAEMNIMNIEGREEIIIRLDPASVQKIEGDIFLLKDDVTVDEIAIPPQKGVKTMKLGYKPAHDSEHKGSTKTKFELEFLASIANGGRQQRIVVRCSAALFTSTIMASQININFGDCQVGQSKRTTFSIENQSPLPGNFIIQLRSKIISIEGIGPKQNTLLEREIKEEFAIAPLSSLQISLKITPQRVNPMYRKQLTIINTVNPNEERIIINIEANNMPPTEAKLHNELYVWESVLQGNEKNEEALCAIVNVPLLIPYVVRSKVDYPLTLQVKTTSREIVSFFSKDNRRSEQLDKCTAELRRACSFDEAEDPSRFSSIITEKVEELRKQLVILLGEGETFARNFTVGALSSVRVYALILRTAFTNEIITKEDGLSISISTVDVPRFVRLSYRLCATYFDLLGQKTKNFGEVNIGIKKATKLSIVNRCRSTLYICISKSRSVTAGHIRIEGSDKQKHLSCHKTVCDKGD